LLPNRQKRETLGTVLRLVGNEKAKYALRGRVLAADEMSLLIDQSPGASFVKPTSKKPSKAAPGPRPQRGACQWEHWLRLEDHQANLAWENLGCVPRLASAGVN
jgi:hypothetical protein